jgi:hypothetical protein
MPASGGIATPSSVPLHGTNERTPKKLRCVAIEIPRIRRKDLATYTVIGELCEVVVEYDIGVAFDEFQ